jgi:hypothetical protein
MTPTRPLLAAACALTLAAAASAHHNMTALFDLNQRFSVSGSLTKVDWRNPHIYLYVDVRNGPGQPDVWSFEGPSPSFFRRNDIERTDFERSLTRAVTVDASRSRDGSHTGLLRQIALADGKVVSMCPQNC